MKYTRYCGGVRTLIPDVRRWRAKIARVKSLERDRELVRGCSRCYPGGGNAPIVDVAKEVRVLLVAQSPGVTEVETRLPFTGPAGRRLEGWFAEAGVSRAEVYLSALPAAFRGRREAAGAGCPGG